MPTVTVVDGFAIRVNIVEDGEAPHVHVIKGGREYRVRLLSDGAQLMTMGGRERTTKAEARRAERWPRLTRHPLM
jgi:hypothetical protein